MIRRVISAGGLVIKPYSDKRYILLVRIGVENGLSFPKGHAEQKESLETATIREVGEETGLQNLSVIKKLGVITRKSTEFSGEEVIKDIHLYLLKSNDFNQIEPQEKCEWILIEIAPKILKFKEESEFLLKIMNELAE